MLHQPLISAQELQLLFIENVGKILVIDARYDLANPTEGLRLYQQEHIPNAHFLDLGKELCGIKTGANGRHPLPTQEDFAQHLRDIGLNQDSHVIVYDQKDCMFSAHLWWMLLWAGHHKVQVLNGGLDAWKQIEGQLSTTIPSPRQSGNFKIQPCLAPTVNSSYILKHLQSPSMLIIDARAPERYRGDVEPLDPVAGHIPGAINRPFALNLADNGLYKTKEQLKQEWAQCMEGYTPERIVHQCGSGVSACHNILAMAYAGFKITTLYPGSWSEWCANCEYPMAKG
ncbi:MAG: sulfurtransferase [Saezia sp.]